MTFLMSAGGTKNSRASTATSADPELLNAVAEAAEHRATELLSRNRVALLALATRLAKAKVLDGNEVKVLLSAEATAAAENPDNITP